MAVIPGRFRDKYSSLIIFWKSPFMNALFSVPCSCALELSAKWHLCYDTHSWLAHVSCSCALTLVIDPAGNVVLRRKWQSKQHKNKLAVSQDCPPPCWSRCPKTGRNTLPVSCEHPRSLTPPLSGALQLLQHLLLQRFWYTLYESNSLVSSHYVLSASSTDEERWSDASCSNWPYSKSEIPASQRSRNGHLANGKKQGVYTHFLVPLKAEPHLSAPQAQLQPVCWQTLQCSLSKSWDLFPFTPVWIAAAYLHKEIALKFCLRKCFLGNPG